MRVSILLPNIDIVVDPKNDVDVNGANIALWIQLRTYANNPAFECLELFLAPKDFVEKEKIQAFAAALLDPENRGRGRLAIHSIYALGDVWADGEPRILHTDDLWALSRDRHLRDRFATGPVAHISDTHCLGHFALHRSLREVTPLDRVEGDAIVACSTALAGVLREDYDLPYRVLAHPRRIDARGLAPASAAEKVGLRQHLGLPTDLPLGLFLGRVTAAMKGELMLLIDSLTTGPGGLVIAGVSNMEGYPEALKTYAQKLGVEDRVFFHGRFAPSERSHWYRACDVFLFPGDCLNEAFGQTTVEALACGLPVIQSDWDGLKDTLRPDAGSLIPTYAAPPPERLEQLSTAVETPTQFLALAQATVVDREAWFAAYARWMGDESARVKASIAARELYERQFDTKLVEAGFVSLLREQMELANSRVRSPSTVTAPGLAVDYSTALQRYASMAWQETFVFEETPAGRQWREGGEAPSVYLELEPLLDTSLFAAVQERVARGPVTSGRLAKLLAGRATTERDVWYHAMFLAKQGFLKVHPAGSPEQLQRV